jgi:hypothetical protein
MEEPGVVAHQLHSPKLHSSDARHQAAARSRPIGVGSLGTSRTGKTISKVSFISLDISPIEAYCISTFRR